MTLLLSAVRDPMSSLDFAVLALMFFGVMTAVVVSTVRQRRAEAREYAAMIGRVCRRHQETES